MTKAFVTHRRLGVFLVALATCLGLLPRVGHAQEPVLCRPSDGLLVSLELPTLEDTPEVSEANLLAWVNALSDPVLEGRPACGAQSIQVAELLARYFASLELTPAGDNGFCHVFAAEDCTDQNVVAVFDADGNGRLGAALLLGAHYDALGLDAAGTPYRGADDNASGVAALAEAARVLARRERRQEVDVVLVAFGGEEIGTRGSRAFRASAPIDLRNVVLMVNLDMVGRPLLEGNFVRNLVPGDPDATVGYVLGRIEPQSTLSSLGEAAERAGVAIYGVPESLLDSLGFRSDSSAFSDMMRTVFLSTSVHADYHQVTDTPDRIDSGQMARATRLALELVGGVHAP